MPPKSLGTSRRIQEQTTKQQTNSKQTRKATRFQTSTLQISGYRHQLHRLSLAFQRWDTRSGAGIINPFTSKKATVAVSFVICIVIIAFGLMNAWLKPAASKGTSRILLTKSGGYYVVYNDTLHQVTNLASARLIINKSEDPRIVRPEELRGDHMGLPMGIPLAPNDMTPANTTTGDWGVCSTRNAPLNGEPALTVNAQPLQTIVFNQPAFVRGTTLGGDKAMIVSNDGGGTVWLLYSNYRTQIFKDDLPVLAALQVTQTDLMNAIPVTTAFLTTVPTRNPLESFTVPHRGEANRLLPQTVNGDIVIIGGSNYLVTSKGVQLVSPFVTQLAENLGGKRITTVSNMTLAAVPHLQDVLKLDYYPTVAPTVLLGSTACYKWSRRVDSTVVFSELLEATELPVSLEDKDRVNQFIHTETHKPAVSEADAILTPSGFGFLVEVVGEATGSLERGQLLWVDSSGIVYPIDPDPTDGSSKRRVSYAKVLGALGLGDVRPLPQPWAITMLYPRGATLSRSAALTYHQVLPVDNGEDSDSSK